MLSFTGDPTLTAQAWHGPVASVAYDASAVAERLHELDRPAYVVETDRGVGLTTEGALAPDGLKTLLVSPPVPAAALGDPGFLETYGLDYAYMGGSMANAIASEAMVVALGRAGMLGAFGAGGLPPQRLEAAIRDIQRALPKGPYAFNLIHSPNEPALERKAVDLYLAYQVPVIEASAYLTLTRPLVRYRAAGLSVGADDEIVIRNRVIAKLSRREVAARFLNPAPQKLLDELLNEGAITKQQATLAARVSMADDITVEADSGGHTDNRPLVCLMPSIIALRDEVQAARAYDVLVRVGAAGGIGTPVSALGAFAMGAAYVVTGSVNHGCVEAGTSPHVKRLLSEAGMADVMMAPAADMFEMGVNLQVLKRGSMFPLRARKLYTIYETYDGIEAIPPAERRRLETQVFQRDLDDVWADCIAFFSERDPRQIERARENPKRKMALIFRWYLGLATRWGIKGEKGRELDYQIWCGPAMGAFNDWVAGTYLEAPEHRYVADVGQQIMEGAAFLYRLQALRMQGLELPSSWGATVSTSAQQEAMQVTVV